MNWDWLAGFIDGDGWFGKEKHSGILYAYLYISQKDKSLLEEIRDFLGSGCITKTNNECWRLRVYNSDFLKKIIHNLEGKLHKKKRIQQFNIFKEIVPLHEAKGSAPYAYKKRLQALEQGLGTKIRPHARVPSDA